MHVAIDTLAHPGGGALRYFSNILPRFADDGNEYLVLVPAGRDELTDIHAENIEYYEVNYWPTNLLTRMIFQQIVLPVLLYRHDVDVLFSPGDMAPLFAPCRIVMMVQNPNPYFDVDLDRSWGEEIKFKLQRVITRISSRRADRVIFVSEHSRDSANRYLGIDERKLEVIHHGVSEEFHSIATADMNPGPEFSDRYILTVSTVLPHKNYELLLRGYARLPADLRNQYDLIIAGRAPSDRYLEQLKELTRQLDVEKNVHLLGEVSEEKLRQLYAGAEVFVLPSKLETFGLTLVEAMASETPVVAANSTCIPEITGKAAALVDPSDPMELARTLERVITDEGYKRGLIDDGRARAGEFSWDSTVDRTREVLEGTA